MFPTKFYLQHQSSDYYPYKACCIDSDDPSFCQKYYDMRPKDNGTECGSAETDRGKLSFILLQPDYIMDISLYFC